MANYYCTSRTNYFHVTDENKYQEIFSHLNGDEGGIIDFTKKDDDGRLLHGFGCEGEISYYENEEDDEPSQDYMVDCIRQLLPDGECFVYMSAGAEKLRYVAGWAVIATKSDVRSIDLSDWIYVKAHELGVSNYSAAY